MLRSRSVVHEIPTHWTERADLAMRRNGWRIKAQMDARPSTFDDFYRQTWPVAFRAGYLIVGDPEAARDLAQEAFVRCFRHWRKVSTLERPEAWMQRTNLIPGLARDRRSLPYLRVGNAPFR
jgi:Sigma-70 region 2